MLVFISLRVQDRVALSLRSEAEQMLWPVGCGGFTNRRVVPHFPARCWGLEMFVETLFHPPEEIRRASTANQRWTSSMQGK